MAKVNIPRVLSICKNLQQTDPLWGMAANCTYKEAALTLASEIEDLRALMADRVPVSGATIRMFEPMFSSCELALVQLTDLVAICVDRTDIKKQLLWPESETQNGTFTLQVLLTNLANTLLAIRQLVLLGLDGQARILLRWFVELSDMTIAAAFDYDCFSHYARGGEGLKEDYERWRAYLTPGKIRRVLRQLDNVVALRDEHPAYKPDFSRRDFMKSAQDIRRETYSWLSLYSHANSLAQTISAIKDVSDDGRLIPKFGGRAGGYADFRSKPTMFNAALYSWMTCSQLFWLLLRKHDWIVLAEGGNEKFGWLYCRGEVLKHYGVIHYSRMMEVTFEEDAG